MITLNNVKHKIKALIKWIGIPLLIIVFISIGIQIKQRLFPPPPPPPAAEFGKLPSISFPKNTTDKKLTFSLDSLTGSLPTFPDRLNVYKTTISKPSFLSLDRARSKVASIGFESNGLPISEETYQWNLEDYLKRKINFNIFSSNFTYSTSFLSNPSVQLATNPLREAEAVTIAQAFIQKLYSSLDDLDILKTKTSFFVIKNYTIIPSVNTSTSDIIRVDFFRKDIDKIPIYYSKPSFSSMNFLVGEIISRLPEVLDANFLHQNISDVSSTYPIKTSTEAFEELRQGKGYIASYSGEETNISIKNAYLAYYMGTEKQAYVMPIIAFEGNNGFFGYISAVRDESVSR